MSGIKVKGHDLLKPGGTLGLRIHLNGSEYRSLPPRQVLLKEGRAETEAIILGSTVSRLTGEQGPDYEGFLYFCADSPLVRGRVLIRGGALEGYAEGVFLEIAPYFSGRNPRIRVNQGSMQGCLTSGMFLR